MTYSIANDHKARWLAAVRATPGLSRNDKRVAEWLANRLEDGTTARGTWSTMKRQLSLEHHAAGVHLTTLTHLGFVGERVRTGPDQGFPLEIPAPKPKAGNDNERRAAARRTANLRADAKWLAGK